MKKAELSKPAIFAHRGIGFGGENTLKGARELIKFSDQVRREKGIGIGGEFDAGSTSDRVPVVLHDTKLNRTTTGTGALKKISFKDLRLLSAGAELDTSNQTEVVPHLGELLTLYTAVEEFAGADRAAELVLDLKDKDPTDLVILDLVKNMGLLPRTRFSSEHLDALVAVKNAEPNARIGLVTQSRDVHTEIPTYAGVGVDYLSPSISTTTDEVLQTCDAYGLEIFPYFQGIQSNWPRARAHINRVAPHVDGIITNHVRETVELFYGPLAA